MEIRLRECEADGQHRRSLYERNVRQGGGHTKTLHGRQVVGRRGYVWNSRPSNGRKVEGM